MSTCMPCSFSAVRSPRSGAVSQLRGPIRLTVTDRYVPLVTAAYGTRVARPASTTMLVSDGEGSQLVRCVGPSPRRPLPHWQEPRRARGSLGGGTWQCTNRCLRRQP